MLAYLAVRTTDLVLVAIVRCCPFIARKAWYPLFLRLRAIIFTPRNVVQREWEEQQTGSLCVPQLCEGFNSVYHCVCLNCARATIQSVQPGAPSSFLPRSSCLSMYTLYGQGNSEYSVRVPQQAWYVNSHSRELAVHGTANLNNKHMTNPRSMCALQTIAGI